MNEELICNLIRARLDDGLSKPQIRTIPILQRVDPHTFEMCYLKVSKERISEKLKQKRERESKFGSKLSFWLPHETLHNLRKFIDWKRINNRSEFYRSVFEFGLKKFFEEEKYLFWEKEENEN